MHRHQPAAARTGDQPDPGRDLGSPGGQQRQGQLGKHPCHHPPHPGRPCTALIFSGTGPPGPPRHAVKRGETNNKSRSSSRPSPITPRQRAAMSGVLGTGTAPHRDTPFMRHAESCRPVDRPAASWGGGGQVTGALPRRGASEPPEYPGPAHPPELVECDVQACPGLLATDAVDVNPAHLLELPARSLCRPNSPSTSSLLPSTPLMLRWNALTTLPRVPLNRRVAGKSVHGRAERHLMSGSGPVSRPVDRAPDVGAPSVMDFCQTPCGLPVFPSIVWPPPM